jgi:hypothetical protein
MYSKIEKIKKIFLIILLGITALGLAVFVIYSALHNINYGNRTWKLLTGCGVLAVWCIIGNKQGCDSWNE